MKVLKFAILLSVFPVLLAAAADRPVSPRFKADRNGSLWAIWSEEDLQASALFFGRVRESGLPERNLVPTPRGTAFSPDFDFSPSNSAWIAWVQYFESAFRVLVREAGTGKTWTVSPPRLVSASGVRVIAGGPEGPWVFWTGRELGRDEIFFSRFDGAGWSPAARFNATSAIPRLFLDAAPDPAGRPWLVWSAYDGEDYEIYWARWNGSAWSEEAKLTDNRDADASPSLAFIQGVVPVVVWSRSGRSGGAVHARFMEAGAWGPEVEAVSGVGRAIVDLRTAVRDGRLVISRQSGDAVVSKSLTFQELKALGPFAPPPAPSSPGETLNENKYVAFGDDITYGVINDQAAPEMGYVPRLEALLKENFGPSEVANEGVPGDSTLNGLGRMSDVLALHSARYILLMEGTNDVISIEVSVDATAFNIEQMVRKVLDLHALPILATIIPRKDWRWNSAIYRDRIYGINDNIRRIAQNLKLPFVDMYETYFNFPKSEGGWRALLSDDVHPTERGYEVMTQAWWNEIRNVPFPPRSVTVNRFMERSLLSGRNINYLTWSHSPKIMDPFLFRSYRIYRKDLGETPGNFRLIAVLPYSPFHNPQRYSDLDIEAARRYEYFVSLLRFDLVEGPPSDPVNDSAK
jgi:lysophospholipase L1-like esterase